MEPQVNGQKHGIAHWFRRFSVVVAEKTGTWVAFIVALSVVLGWALTGPLFGFSQTWQLVINTGTTIVTFLMVFLLQATQNRDSKALHLKLDELIRTSRARNVFADLEEADEDELKAFQAEFKKLREQGMGHLDSMAEAHKRVHPRHDDPPSQH